MEIKIDRFKAEELSDLERVAVDFAGCNELPLVDPMSIFLHMKNRGHHSTSSRLDFALSLFRKKDDNRDIRYNLYSIREGDNIIGFAYISPEGGDCEGNIGPHIHYAILLSNYPHKEEVVKRLNEKLETLHSSRMNEPNYYIPPLHFNM